MINLRKIRQAAKNVMRLSFWLAANGSFVSSLQAAEIVYYSDVDIYYEIIYLPPPVRQNDVSWSDAADLASKKTFKGRKGQLAVIDTKEEHQFLIDKFDFRQETWIGLRYWCSTRLLTWIDGKEHDAQSFQPWAIPWHRTQVRCSRNRIPYMPIYYNEQKRWQASGSSKKFMAFLVEYKPISKK